MTRLLDFSFHTCANPASRMHGQRCGPIKRTLLRQSGLLSPEIFQFTAAEAVAPELSVGGVRCVVYLFLIQRSFQMFTPSLNLSPVSNGWWLLSFDGSSGNFVQETRTNYHLPYERFNSNTHKPRKLVEGKWWIKQNISLLMQNICLGNGKRCGLQSHSSSPQHGLLHPPPAS